MRGEPARESPAAGRHRDVLLVVLIPTTGAVDAVSFARLGKVFSSVITGNLALLGVAAGQQDKTLALNAGVALAGYAAGVLAGYAAGSWPAGSWPEHQSRSSRSGPSRSPAPWRSNSACSPRSAANGSSSAVIRPVPAAWRC